MPSVVSQPPLERDEVLHALIPDLQVELDRVLSWWAARMISPRTGRIVGTILNSGLPDDTSSVRGIYLSRILWAFSRAAAYSSEPRLSEIADHAADQLVTDFIDVETGGVLWETDHAGKPLDGRKQCYALAFALYGLSAYYRVSKRTDIADVAASLFHQIEARFRDPVHGGYWEAFTRNWDALDDVRLSDKDQSSPKSMNTHLHVMEAYAEYYRATGSEPVRQAMATLVDLFTDRIVDDKRGHLRMFWSADWCDESLTESFGHDIEASWLTWEAVNLVGDPEQIARARMTVLRLAESCATEGVGRSGEIYDEYDHVSGHINTTRIWWVQAEGLVGFLNAYQMTGKAEYRRRVMELWRFVNDHVIDRDGGEWRWFSSLDTTEESPYWGGPWKSCYHNVRTLIECLERIHSIPA